MGLAAKMKFQNCSSGTKRPFAQNTHSLGEKAQQACTVAKAPSNAKDANFLQLSAALIGRPLDSMFS